jgi:hypothetical protein
VCARPAAARAGNGLASRTGKKVQDNLRGKPPHHCARYEGLDQSPLRFVVVDDDAE